MKDENFSKIIRQVRLFYSITALTEPGLFIRVTANDLMTEAGIKSRRTFERDLADLRDSGVVNVVYDRHEKKNGNKIKLYHCEFNESVTGSRRARLIHLNRLCNVLYCLDGTLIDDYYNELDKMNDCLESGEKYTPDEDIFYDIIGEYEKLFPGTSTRTRQRDFHIINCAGKYISSQNDFFKEPDFEIIYNKKLKKYVFLIYQNSGYFDTAGLNPIPFEDNK